jgi:hypothetical protein
MAREAGRALAAVIIATAVGATLAVAGSQAGAIAGKLSAVAVCIGLALAFQRIAIVPALPQPSDRFLRPHRGCDRGHRHPARGAARSRRTAWRPRPSATAALRPGDLAARRPTATPFPPDQG